MDTSISLNYYIMLRLSQNFRCLNKIFLSNRQIFANDLNILARLLYYTFKTKNCSLSALDNSFLLHISSMLLIMKQAGKLHAIGETSK